MLELLRPVIESCPATAPFPIAFTEALRRPGVCRRGPSARKAERARAEGGESPHGILAMLKRKEVVEAGGVEPPSEKARNEETTCVAGSKFSATASEPASAAAA